MKEICRNLYLFRLKIRNSTLNFKEKLTNNHEFWVNLKFHDKFTTLHKITRTLFYHLPPVQLPSYAVKG